jgi:hypothetical protein
MANLSIKTGVISRSMLVGNTAYVPPSFESIATATPSAQSSITFSSIPSTYKHLQIRFALIASAAYQSYRIQLNGDTGDTNYVSHGLRGNGTNVNAVGYATGAGYSSIVILERNGTVATSPNVGIIDIQDYASTTKNKTLRTFVGADNNNTDGSIELDSGLFISLSAITSFNLRQSTGTFTGVVSLYGIKG